MRHITLILAVVALAFAAPAIADKGGSPNGGNGNAESGAGNAVGKNAPATQDTSPVASSGAENGHPGAGGSGKTKGIIWVTDGLRTADEGMSSHFTTSGCGFRAGDDSYYMVIRGPGLYTDGLTYWVDHFPVSSDGCGSASPTWSGSGVPGSFDVYVVRSPSNNPWQAQPVSNVVTIYISNP
jgi:hypothetical protein